MAKPVRHGKKWRIRWVDENGQRQSAVYDAYNTAVADLARRNHEVNEIRLGRRPAASTDRTFGDLCDYWLEHRAPQKRSRKDDESIIRVHLRPEFGELLIRDIRQKHVDPYIRRKQDLHPKTVANTITLLIAMLNLAKDELEWLDRVPKLRKPSCAQQDYSYLRTDEEVMRFLRSARAEGDMVYMLYLVAVFTGMRAGEIAALRWEDVDLERGLITVQRSYDGPTKNSRLRHVPIGDPLLGPLREWKLRHPGTLVFTNRDGGMYGKLGRRGRTERPKEQGAPFWFFGPSPFRRQASPVARTSCQSARERSPSARAWAAR